MEQEKLPHEDCDLERIRANIRRERFILLDVWRRWRLSCFAGGAALGLALGIWAVVAEYCNLAGIQIVNWKGPFAPTAALVIVLLTIVGGLGGLAILALLSGLFLFFRPILVAIRQSPEEFKRQYPDPPK
jgi:hypothetical protein